LGIFIEKEGKRPTVEIQEKESLREHACCDIWKMLQIYARDSKFLRRDR
jgi:hypothetical protein